MPELAQTRARYHRRQADSVSPRGNRRGGLRLDVRARDHYRSGVSHLPRRSLARTNLAAR